MSDDEDFQRAIALSLQESNSNASHPIEADSSETQSEHGSSSSASRNRPEDSTKTKVTTPMVEPIPISVRPQTAQMSAFLRERTEMERARLARRAEKTLGPEGKKGSTAVLPSKVRKTASTSVSTPVIEISSDSERDSGSEQGLEKRPAKRQKQSTQSHLQYDKEERLNTLLRMAQESADALSERMLDLASAADIGSGSTSRSDRNLLANSELYWEGELRQTANRHVDRENDTRPTFRLSEIIGPKSEVAFAILSSYSNMVSWLYSFFNMDTPIILVNQPEDGNAGVKELAPNLLMTKPFLRANRGSMHIKLMVIIYKDNRLRVVVPTANFVDYDWRDIENTVWLQDIPMREEPIAHDSSAKDFPATLQRVLIALNVPVALMRLQEGKFPAIPISTVLDLRKRWDWSKVKVRMVASLAGKHEGQECVSAAGHPALGSILNELGARTPKGKKLVLECQGSSIGTYSASWINEFYSSARGESTRSWLDRPKGERQRLGWPAVKIIFPSFQTVKESVLGFPGGGTMFCRKSQWEGKRFPRELFHDSNSKRGRVLMHSKMIIATFRDLEEGRVRITEPAKSQDSKTESETETNSDSGNSDTVNADERIEGWAYVGSHNFTPSAWGTLSGSASNPVLNITNYEMGVVFPLRHSEGGNADTVACWMRPPRKYVTSVDRAWMQDEMPGR